jgi:hypothetical protein
MAASNARWLSILGSAILCAGCSSPDGGPVARSGRAAEATARAAVSVASSACSAPSRDAAGSPATPSTAVAASVTRAGEPLVGASSSKTGRSADRRDETRTSNVPLHVKRLVLARSVAGHEPVDVATSFSAAQNDRIYAFVEVDNPERAESQIVVTFEPEHGSPTGFVRLDVGASPRWRTWAYTRAARQPGAWAAVVRDGNGVELGRTAFEVTGAAAGSSGASSAAATR